MSVRGRVMRSGTSVRIFIVSATLLFALLDNSAIAQYSITQISRDNTLLELNPYLHGAATPAPATPNHLATPALRQPRSVPERPQTGRLAVAKPNVRAQQAIGQEPPIGVKHGRPGNKAAGRPPANTREIQIVRPLAPPSPQAAVVRATNAAASAPEPVVAVAGTVAAGPPVQPNASGPAEVEPMPKPPGATNTAASVPEPIEVVAPARQIPATPEPAVAVVETVAAGPPVQPNASNPADIEPMPTPPGATNTAARAPEPVEVVGQARLPETAEPAVAVVETVAAGPPVQPNAKNPVEAEPMSTPPGATNTAASAPESVEVVAAARQIPETPEPVADVTGTVTAGPPVRPNASNPVEAEPMSTASAPSGTSAWRAVLLWVAPAMLFGFLVWGARRQLVPPVGSAGVSA
jgi:hypothetical protein